MASCVIGVVKDLVLVPTVHDTTNELTMPVDVRDWKKGECDPIPGRTMPSISVVERDYPNLHKQFTSLGPLLDKFGNGGKGMQWDTQDEVDFLGDLNHRVTEEGISKGRPRIESAIDACEVILSLPPETDGHRGDKARGWRGGCTGREHTRRARGRRRAGAGVRPSYAEPAPTSSPTSCGRPVWPPSTRRRTGT